MTLPPSSQIRLQRSTTPGQRPTTTAAAELGEVSVNIPDRKLFMRDGTGTAVTVADRIVAFSAARPYEAGDITVYDGGLWQAKAAVPAGAWNPTLWAALGATGAADPILKVPAGDATNTITMIGNPSRKGLAITGDPAQTGNLLEIPGTSANDGRSAIIDALGFPNERLGPSIFRVVQATHGFAFIGQPIAFTGGKWAKAQANAVATRCIAVIEQVLDANTFVLRTGDRITQLQVNAFAGGVILPETIYYVSDTVAGQLTTEASVTRPDPVLYTISTSVALVMIGYAGGAGYVQRTGDTMTGNLTLAGTTRVSFDTGAAALFKGAGTPSIFAHVGGVLSARVDEADSVAAYNETLLTRLKADTRYDARYIKLADKNAVLLELFNIMYPVGSIYSSITNAPPAWGTWVAWGQGRAMVGVGTADGTTWAVNEAKGSSNVTLVEAQIPAHAHVVDPPAQNFNSGTESAGHSHGVGQNPHAHSITDKQHNHGLHDPGHKHTVSPRGGINQGAMPSEPFEGQHDSGGSTSWDGTGIYIDAAWSGIGATNNAYADIWIGGRDTAHYHTTTVDIGAFWSQNTGGNGAHNNIQPSIGVYLFRRTA